MNSEPTTAKVPGFGVQVSDYAVGTADMLNLI